MSLRRVALPILFSVLAFAGFQAQAASTLRIPPADYPPGARITYSPHLSNHDLDCLWGLACELGGVPNFHRLTQSLLGRQRGWAQFAHFHGKGKPDMGFELFASRYRLQVPGNKVAGGRRAFDDFKAATHAQGYTRLSRAGAGLSLPKSGDGVVEVQHLTGQDLTVMAVWTGNVEIEGIASYKSSARSELRMARRLLSKQITFALRSGV